MACYVAKLGISFASMTTGNTGIDMTKKPVTGDWHHRDIIAAVWKAGSSIQRLSRENGYARDALALALRRPWPRAERLIAEAIGTTPQAIWPSRYHPDGAPRSGRGERGRGSNKAKGSTRPPSVNVEKQEAA